MHVSYLSERKLLLFPVWMNTVWDHFRNSKPLFETGLTCWNGRFRPVDDATGLDADAAAESSHADSVTNRILQASANFQNLSQSRYPLLLRNSPLLLLTRSTLAIQIRAIVVFQVGNVKLASLTDIGSLYLYGGRLKTESLRTDAPPRYLPIKPKGATRRKMRNQSLKRSPY